MNRIIFSAIALVMALSACQSPKVSLSGRFVGSDADMVYLEYASVLEQTIIDSVKLGEDGNFALSIENVTTTPSLYYIIYNNERIPLLLQQGDNVEINAAGNVARNYKVEGSEESELLREFNQEYISGVMKLRGIISKIAAGSLSDEERKSLSEEYTKIYLDIKRKQMNFIVSHKQNIAAVYALHQRLPNDSYLFNGDSDVIYYRTVAEAIEQSYPESHYLPILRSQVARMSAQSSLLAQAKEVNFPEIKMPDMYGQEVALSSLSGKVILLHFWSVAIGNGNVINAEMKEIYNRYKEQGFEIYQVAIDTSKSDWINAIQEQQLPWISVSDMKGEASTSLGEYNVQRLPSNFLIDREGNIVAKDLVGDKLEAEIKKHI
ncbi:MAG: AhpC/TSA family protein [Alistipes sp.]|nr:AhpC/TSA family protein [Alistipes sp.]